jgi:antitoxin ParD1/3/4
MNVSLTPELENFVAQKVESGLYQTASEVIREGLRLMRERDEKQKKLDELRKEIQLGLDDLEQGKFAPFNEETLEKIKANVRVRRAQAKGKKP